MQIHGYHNNSHNYGSLSEYGSDANKIKELVSENSNYNELLHPNHSIVIAEIIWSVRNEMARNIEDFLSRRTRLLIIDAKASVEAASTVAKYMAKELGYNRKWQRKQLKEFSLLADNYIVK